MVAVLAVVGGGLEAQEPDSLRRRGPPPDSLRADSLRQDSLVALTDSVGNPVPVDTTVGKTVGLPTAPSRQFPSLDSIMEVLLNREGYRSTRYAGDSVVFLAPTSEIFLRGSALVEREGSILESENVTFRQEECQMLADGEPTMFDAGTVMVGDTMSYDTCVRTGIVDDAFTNFNQSGVDWFMRGEGMAIDSAASRIYGATSEITSCDLDEPHFHFSMADMKWVRNNIMVARGVSLYMRDVPVFWFPIMFQDMRQGRRSGMLTPRFGFNDLVRPNQDYRRHVTNVGYYFALNDYLDAQASLDWLQSTNVSVNGQVQYRWLDRFVDGSLSLSRIFESGRDGQRGRRSLALRWNHRQQFNEATNLTASVDYVSSSSVVQQNTVDPLVQTADLQSRINFTKTMDWGTLNVGGSRSQSLSDDQVRETLPTLALTPVPIMVTEDITWQPSFSVNNSRVLNQRMGLIELPPVGGQLTEPDTLFAKNRTTTLNFTTPIRIGRFNWRNDFTITDAADDRRTVVNVVDPNDSSQTYQRVYGENFSTEVNWNTGINLPSLFASTWKIQPSIGIQNAGPGAFMVKNRNTGGRFVQQGKRLTVGASSSPTLFGFWPGIGPLQRIRHGLAFQAQWQYAPSAEVSREFQLALNPNATNLNNRSLPVHAVRLSLSQTFEGKYRLPESDSTSNQDPNSAPKVKLLSWQTTGVEYDFEQAKEPGRNGWKTPTMTNSFTSDLLRGFTLRVVHELWDGQVGYDTTRFDPFLKTVSARFSINGSTFMRLVQALMGAEPLQPQTAQQIQEADSLAAEEFNAQPDYLNDPTGGPATAYRSIDRIAPAAQRGQGFTTSVTYDDQRSRPVAMDPAVVANPFATPGENRTVGLTTAFSPTENWGLSWTTQYNFTTGEFGQHILRFDRDLHRWRATFGFTRSPNGNFAFTFFVNLLDQPEIKFNYDQQTISR